MFKYLSSWISTPDENAIFSKKLVKRLTKEAVNCPDLFKKLKETESVIAGSLPLQIVLGETWVDSDLDIFCKNQEMLLYFNQFYKAYPISEADSKRYNVVFDQVVEYHTPTGFKIQVIWSKSLKEIVKDTLDRFDFDFCKVAFDGDKFHIAVPEAVKSRSCTFNYNPHSTSIKNYHRLIKYEKRGFIVSNREEFIQKMLEQSEKSEITLRSLKNISESNLRIAFAGEKMIKLIHEHFSIHTTMVPDSVPDSDSSDDVESPCNDIDSPKLRNPLRKYARS